VNESRTGPSAPLRLLFIGLAMAAFGPRGTAAADDLAELRTENATIVYPVEDERFAHELGQAFEWGLKVVAEDLGRPAHRVTIHVYRTKAEMADGAVAILGRTRSEAQGIARAGMSDRDRDAILVIASASRWGDLLWQTIAHEHAHGMTTERFGPALADKARWMFEGLGEYEGTRALEAKSPEAARDFRIRRFKVAFKALVKGQLPSLDEISDRATWFVNINTDVRKWDRQYACAYVAMDYLVRTYGFSKVGEVLKEAGAGVPYGTALAQVLGISTLGLEARVLGSLAVTGFFDLYPRYTAALALLAVTLLITAVLLLRGRRRSS
jgi:hypothetical protein